MCFVTSLLGFIEFSLQQNLLSVFVYYILLDITVCCFCLILPIVNISNSVRVFLFLPYCKTYSSDLRALERMRERDRDDNLSDMLD